MKKMLAKALVTAGLASGVTGAAFGCDLSYPYIGSICFTAASFCSEDSLPADGRQMPINQNQALYSVLGSLYGGDNKTYFNLPDLRGRVPVGTGQGPGLSNVALAVKRGQESVTLTTNQMAPHTHTATFTPQTGPQTVTIPGSTGTGTLNATGSVELVAGAPDSSATNTPGSGAYNLTGVSVNSGPTIYTTKGPYTTKSVGANPPAISAKVVVTPSTDYVPATSTKQVTVNAVTGGAVAVGVNGYVPPTSAQAAVPTLPPELGLTACIATDGIYPYRP